MRVRLRVDGRELAGTAEQIVQAMRAIAQREDLDLPAYMAWAAGFAQTMEGAELDTETPERFVSSMVAGGLAERVDQDI